MESPRSDWLTINDCHAWFPDLKQLALTVGLRRTKLFKTDFGFVVLIHILDGSCSGYGDPQILLPLFVSAANLKNLRRFADVNSQIQNCLTINYLS
ncbi:hypothetical protein [Nostoc sp. PA-18-2419]|uniref:hypothetical protein n=1 Tax=Nostoc sp. PA-18-2419 TaxID=2575443 RepID=UPI0011094177|nr:hypothetical protein [Nostoc sp. PA-18-2419]